MRTFTISKPGSREVVTGCPEIALQFGGALLENDAERSRLQEFLRPHLEIQAGIRALIALGLGDGAWIESERPEAMAVKARIEGLRRHTEYAYIGLCTVTYNPRSR